MTKTRQYKSLGAAIIEVSMQVHSNREVSIKRNGGIWYVTSKGVV